LRSVYVHRCDDSAHESIVRLMVKTVIPT